ncbi:ATP-dependent helicase [Halobacillus sp. HZG1]|uniref:ATP-dependent helicase n=1 Tax=Halobacillus sp. HZG1 TaxID=3111769 RepID=UPI002DBD8E83|nr:ATP-dependent helicase [Halobacillus sp. HZG1]MEC3884615.1 ATP-dependent helicase [Halobacillus sp. HZG1]
MFPLDNSIREEILETEGNISISASAGTGKTYTTVKRINKDLEKINTHQTFAAITFTRKAAKEIKERIGFVTSDSFIGTNDTFVLMEIINPFIKDVYGREYKRDFKQDFSNENAIDDFQEGLNKLLELDSVCKYRNIRRNFAFELAHEIVKNSKAARRYLKSKYFRIYIDEYQDSDQDMHKLFKYICLVLNIPLFIVGDTKQSIYRWRGAYSEGFNELIGSDDFNSFELFHNFRSNKPIQNYSNIFMENARKYFQETEFSDEVTSYRFDDEGQATNYIKSWLNEELTCSFLNYRRASAQEWSALLNNDGLQFVYIPPSPLEFSEHESEHIWIARLIASFFLEERYNEYDVYSEIPFPEAFKFKVIQDHLNNLSENRSNKKLFIEKAKDLYDYLGYQNSENIVEELALLFDVINDEQYVPFYNSGKYNYTVSTIHSSKGLEFDQVIIVGNDYNFSSEDDRYLHYVAVSRPKTRLLILLFNGDHQRYYNELNNSLKQTNAVGFNIELNDVIKRLKPKGL